MFMQNEAKTESHLKSDTLKYELVILRKRQVNCPVCKSLEY